MPPLVPFTETTALETMRAQNNGRTESEVLGREKFFQEKARQLTLERRGHHGPASSTFHEPTRHVNTFTIVIIV